MKHKLLCRLSCKLSYISNKCEQYVSQIYSLEKDIAIHLDDKLTKVSLLLKVFDIIIFLCFNRNNKNSD